MQIIMLGASLQQNGGIATVENLILKHISIEIKIQHITTHDEGSILHRIIVFTKAVAKFLGQLFTQNIDAIHIHISDGGSLVRKALLVILAWPFGKPIIMHAHGAEFQVTYQKLPQWLQKVFAAIFRRCQGFIVLSETWENYYIQNLGLNKKQVFVLPNPTELPTQIPHRKNSDPVSLVFCGRVGERKGTFDLITAFSQLSEPQKKSAQLILAGDGEIEKARQLAVQFNIAEQVTFLGWINTQQRDKILSQADVFILPSYNEGLPMAILEAMGWGLPIIATPVGGIPELVINNQNGLIVTPGNIQELSEAMALLIKDEQLRLSLGTAARKNVEPYDITNYCHLLVDIYRSLSQFN
ncbi:glycosyltransferase family 4 protein [Anabaena catenula]|uniref:Glycosyltransferase family 4 protein n=1 Tax=Anabaena catenula FACHB-362 TaxID=2692877 RepID=A0ABR8IYT2_9NOST|nr:glycosyltransferase family 4 protein [Anabaena catenula]MBD2690455.1 glycosyltransferase family 4 protein [Anabaena catenula FACHB-362]